MHAQRRAAQAERGEQVPYASLPQEMRDAMSKKEYGRTVVRADAADGEALLPVVVFCFSKKKCEEIADFFGGQDLLDAREKGEVRALMAQAARRLSAADARLPQVTAHPGPHPGPYLIPYVGPYLSPFLAPI